MPNPTDVRPIASELFFLPVQTRVPLKFGTETTTSVTCARVCVTVEGRDHRRADGWGETPLSVQWVWPSKLAYAERHERLKHFCILLVRVLHALIKESYLCQHTFRAGRVSLTIANGTSSMLRDKP